MPFESFLDCWEWKEDIFTPGPAIIIPPAVIHNVDRCKKLLAFPY